MAFSVSGDHERQEQVFERLKASPIKLFITATNVGCDGEFQAPVIVRVEREGVELGLVRDLRRVPGHRYAPDAVESVP